ncbi:MAG: hypothetical protein IKX34_05130 [Bacteroidales bacterium]|nr:hypothetical protein [Bacteroidales bacterium]
MNDKEKYTALMQRYFEADTTSEEERELAWYVARVDDPAFDELRGVLGYLSIGREKKARKAVKVRMYAVAAAAACLVALVAVGLSLRSDGLKLIGDLCVSYAYGEKTTDGTAIMASVESSLSDFFAGETPAETNLIEMFQR